MRIQLIEEEMYYKIDDFEKDWVYESEATIKLLKNLTDESLKQKVTDEGRSLGFLAWHITSSISEMMNRTGFNIESVDENCEPETAAVILAAYEKSARAINENVKEKWTDASLSEEVNMYGENWSKGKILSVLVVHQIHHRAQMTVLMRQAGLKVLGIYGPSKEEWAQFGMPALK